MYDELEKLYEQAQAKKDTVEVRWYPLPSVEEYDVPRELLEPGREYDLKDYLLYVYSEKKDFDATEWDDVEYLEIDGEEVQATGFTPNWLTTLKEAKEKKAKKKKKKAILRTQKSR